MLDIATCAVCCNIAAGQTKNDKLTPNIIFILADDLGYGDVNFNNDSLDRFINPYIQTPSLAKLASESVIFTQQYATSPVCSPSRAGLLTGKIPNRCNIDIFIADKNDNDKVFLSGKEITIAELLKDAGYNTAIFGKWHLNGADWEDKSAWTGWTGSFPNQQGFEIGLVSKENPHLTRELDKNSQKNPGDFFYLNGEPAGVIEGFSSQIITDNAISWITEKRDEKTPFFLYLPYDAVHELIVNPDEYNNMYNTGDHDKDQYYANVTFLDHEIGRLMDVLDSSGLRENTIVFFTSDNGPEIWRTNPMAGRCFGTSYPLHGQKRQLFEGGIKVPGLISWPGKIVPGVSNFPNVHYDVLPTICEFAGVTIPESLEIDGISIYEHIMKRTDIKREMPIYWQFEKRRRSWDVEGEFYNQRFIGNKISKEHLPPQVVIRQDNYILHGFCSKELYSKPVSYKLYNLEKDPLCNTNISGDNPVLLQQMILTLEKMHDDVNADRQKRAEENRTRVNQ